MTYEAPDCECDVRKICCSVINTMWKQKQKTRKFLHFLATCISTFCKWIVSNLCIIHMHRPVRMAARPIEYHRNNHQPEARSLSMLDAHVISCTSQSYHLVIHSDICLGKIAQLSFIFFVCNMHVHRKFCLEDHANCFFSRINRH